MKKINSFEKTSKEIINDLQSRVEQKILEKSNYDFLLKLINKADNLDEINKIASLGTNWNKTGLYFDKKIEKFSNHFQYFCKNNELSFGNDGIRHKLIIGDNYYGLLNLLISYKDKIDFIYIDPPYGCNDMGEYAKTNYDNEITRDNLLSMLEIRLRIAKSLLSSTGAIFCSIDDKNFAYLKCLFDDVFGENNFICNFVRKTSASPRMDAKNISINCDYIICFTKNKELFFNKKLSDTYSLDNKNLKKDEFFDERGYYILNKLDRGSITIVNQTIMKLLLQMVAKYMLVEIMNLF